MNIGSAWTKTTQEGKTTISVTLDETIVEVCPQLKNLKFGLKYLNQDERGTNEKAPHWKVYVYKPQAQTQNASADAANKAIIEQGAAEPPEQSEQPAPVQATTNEEIPF